MRRRKVVKRLSQQDKEQLCLILFRFSFISFASSALLYLDSGFCVGSTCAASHWRRRFNAVCASCRRRKGEKLFLVAFYECNEDFELENLEQDRLYCSREAWVGDAPKCMAINDEDGDDEEGLSRPKCLIGWIELTVRCRKTWRWTCKSSGVSRSDIKHFHSLSTYARLK